MIYIVLLALLIAFLAIMLIVFMFLNTKIRSFEQGLIRLFISRTDLFPAIYGVCEGSINKHKEIFEEIFTLRKQEFTLNEMSDNIEGYIGLEQKIHHEINFIFQVCNKNPLLLKDKKFLYIRDIVIERSSDISQKMKLYKKIVTAYNRVVKIKNYTLIGLLLPFKQKKVL